MFMCDILPQEKDFGQRREKPRQWLSLKIILYNGVILRDFSPEGSGVHRRRGRDKVYICFTPDPSRPEGRSG
jgi:hypothetical protein